MLKQLSQKTGLTTAELNVFVFFIIVLSAGIFYKYSNHENPVQLRHFDYSERDSLFKAAGNTDENGEKRFDYKQEVLDFNTQNFNKVKTEKTAAEKSINLNTADFNDLVSIPGLGEKTADKILEYRSEIGIFKSLDQLKDIKGIGTKKFNKIKIYIYLD
jgi:competence ComEA-like helix-hairpin-helix protein